MWNVDGNHGNASFAILGGYDGRNRFIGLKFNGEIHFLPHQEIGVALRNLRTVAIVERDEFNALRLCGPLQTGGDFAGKLIIGALRRVSQAAEPRFQRSEARLVEIGAQFLDHAALLECIKQTKGHGLRKSASQRNLPQRKSLPRGAESRNKPGAVDDGFDQIRVTGGSSWAHGGGHTITNCSATRNQNFVPSSHQLAPFSTLRRRLLNLAYD